MLTNLQIDKLLNLVTEAGKVAMFYFHQDYKIDIKNDSTPVTEADIAISRLLEAELQKIHPIPVLSEEGTLGDYDYLDWPEYWLIDPIDGTKEFVKKTNEFCVCIALIKNNKPIFGLLHSPVLKTSWFASQGTGVFEKKDVGLITKLDLPLIEVNSLVVVLGHVNIADSYISLLENTANYKLIKKGSALKFIDIVRQKANLYPKLGKTSEWDTAAAQVILEEAGGKVVDFQGNNLRYGYKRSLLNPPFIAADHYAINYIKQLQKNYRQMQGKTSS